MIEIKLPKYDYKEQMELEKKLNEELLDSAIETINLYISKITEVKLDDINFSVTEDDYKIFSKVRGLLVDRFNELNYEFILKSASNMNDSYYTVYIKGRK